MPTSAFLKTYDAPPQPGNPRGTEAWALTQAALSMKAARDADDHDRMLAAIRLNWRLWTIIQAELLDPQCAVPMDIRTNVLSLAQFVDKHTVAIIGNPSPRHLDVLIGINRELAGGLFTTPGAESRVPAGESASMAVDGPTKPGAVGRMGPPLQGDLPVTASLRIST